MKYYAEYELNKASFSKGTLREEYLRKLMADPDSFEIKEAYYRDQSGNMDQKEKDQFDAALSDFRNCYEKSETEQVEADIFACMALYGIAPEEYFQFKFYEKNDRGRCTFMCDKERFALFRPFYDFDRYERIRNKWLQYQELGQYYGRDLVYPDPESADQAAEYDKFLKFLSAHPVFLWKPVRGNCGAGIRRINSADFDKETLFRSLITEDGVMDELIRQEDSVASFHPGSVNTVRLIAIRSPKGKNYYTQSLFRMACGDGIVDNDKYALRARIDETSGHVMSRASDSFGNKYVLHPDTKLAIVGFHIPRWDELLSLADEIMERMSDIARFIGFDMALTPKGWVVVEVNPFPQLVTQQIIMGEGIKQEIERILAECESEEDA